MQHIAFIMDGNRTWARAHGLPSFEGHRRGYENLKPILKHVKKLGIPYVSFWALSDDNIRERSPEEVGYLFDLLTKGILDFAKTAKKDNIRMKIIGDRSLLPEGCQRSIEKAELITDACTETKLLFAIGYGGQEEIARAVNSLVASGEYSFPITRAAILNHLETGAYPPPDLIIRTGGHIRHSGFFLFQSPYAEYGFSSKNWPEFTPDDVDELIGDFQNRTRKFGK